MNLLKSILKKTYFFANKQNYDINKILLFNMLNAGGKLEDKASIFWMTVQDHKTKMIGK
eukprot:CAMPEP_0170542862 /NCGR_PEP_ID=MMETSP0211-20121228/2162_1 /TAXON_ID=311385 /ORGANISM="Pseudokeronopsis sp., Strain OXSARD2" /LENGTH=58 /DNA_ID=CAMNT_0010846069 /DNA_START=166 /DNA_END=342 /DNA_ORIENTATION=-